MIGLSLINDWVGLNKYMNQLKTNLSEVFNVLNTLSELNPVFDEWKNLALVIGVPTDSCAGVSQCKNLLAISDLSIVKDKLNSARYCLIHAFKHYESLNAHKLVLDSLIEVSSDGISLEICKRCFKCMDIESLST